MDVVINITAVLGAAIAQMVLGSLWYGSFFKKPWMKLVGFSEQDKAAATKKGMGKLYFAAFVGSFVTAYVLAHFVAFLQPDGYIGAMQLGFWLWLGFVATAMLGQVLWVNKPIKLYAIDSGYCLVSLMLMSVILTYWQ